MAKLVTVSLDDTLANVQAAINAAIDAQEALGFDLAQAVEVDYCPIGKGEGKNRAILMFEPRTAGAILRSGRVVLLDVALDDFTTFDATIQAPVTANESNLERRHLVGRPHNAILNPKGDAQAVYIYTFGLSPSRQVADGQDADTLVMYGDYTHADGTTPSDVAAYRIDVPELHFDWLGSPATIAAVADRALLGAQAAVCKLDGGDAVALTADGKGYFAVSLIAKISNVLTHVIVIGDEANQGAEAIPTKTEIADALAAKFGANWTNEVAKIVGVTKITRSAVDTMAMAVAPTIAADVAQLKRWTLGKEGLVGPSDKT